MAETQEARIEVDQTPYGYEVEKTAIPTMDAEVPVGDTLKPESFDARTSIL